MFWFTGLGSSQRRFESIVVVAMLCVFCTAAECYAQAKTQPAKQALQRGMKASPSGTFDIHYRDADLRGVLQLLSTQGRRNIVATKEVVGTVTADLYGVTFKEALNAVLMANGFVYLEKDNFIYVYTPKQLETILMAG